jgi:hypothetical protein
MHRFALGGMPPDDTVACCQSETDLKLSGEDEPDEVALWLPAFKEFFPSTLRLLKDALP